MKLYTNNISWTTKYIEDILFVLRYNNPTKLDYKYIYNNYYIDLYKELRNIYL